MIDPAVKLTQRVIELEKENANLRATIVAMHKLMANTMDGVNELFTLTIAGYREEESE